MLDIYHSLSVKCLNCCRFLQHDSFSHVCVSVLGQWRWIKMQTECRRTVVHWVVQLSHQLLWCTLNWKLMCCDSTVFKELRLWDFLLVRRRAADVFFCFIYRHRSISDFEQIWTRQIPGGFFSNSKTLQLVRSHQCFSLLSVFNDKCWDCTFLQTTDLYHFVVSF